MNKNIQTLNHHVVLRYTRMQIYNKSNRFNQINVRMFVNHTDIQRFKKNS